MLMCRTSEELMLYLGAALGYWRGDIKGLVDDIGRLGTPTHCAIAPLSSSFACLATTLCCHDAS